MGTSRTAVVVGGGIVGSVQALLLSRAGFKVTLVDAAPKVANTQPKSDSRLSLRSVAVSYRSKQLLESVGLWVNDAACPIRSVLVNEKGRFGSVRLTAEELHLPALGYVVINHQLESYLAAAVAADSMVEFVAPANAQIVSADERSATVQVQHQDQVDTIETDLLVIADGTGSSLRDQLGIRATVKDYQQAAVVTNVRCQRHHNHVAYERFTDTGPLALLPIGDRTMSVVYTISTQRVEEVSAFSDEQLKAEIQQRFGGRLGRFESLGPRGVIPLKLVQSEQQTSGCCVFIGNAARTLHPVAGQGFNLALRDAMELAGQLSNGGDVMPSLANFAGNRRMDQKFVVGQTDLLARLFRSHTWPLAVPLDMLKLSSMLVLDNLAPLRRGFAERNAGLSIALSPLPLESGVE